MSFRCNTIPTSEIPKIFEQKGLINHESNYTSFREIPKRTMLIKIKIQHSLVRAIEQHTMFHYILTIAISIYIPRRKVTYLPCKVLLHSPTLKSIKWFNQSGENNKDRYTHQRQGGKEETKRLKMDLWNVTKKVRELWCSDWPPWLWEGWSCEKHTHKVSYLIEIAFMSLGNELLIWPSGDSHGFLCQVNKATCRNSTLDVHWTLLRKLLYLAPPTVQHQCTVMRS